MNIRELLNQISTQYLDAKQETFTNNPIANLVRYKSQSTFERLVDTDIYKIKGSVGQGQWANVPWIAIFNKKETEGAREGVYIVYLFSENMKRIYLTLHQGVSNVIKRNGKRLGLKKLLAKAQDIQVNYPISNEGFKSDKNMNLANEGMAAIFSKTVIFYKEYDTNDLPREEFLQKDFKILLGHYQNYLDGENIITYDTKFADTSVGVEEGKRILKIHYTKERNPRIIKEVKSKILKETGELRCEVCGFVFAEHYGERGKDYIEGHHKLPISQMNENSVTNVEDIALVCSNCHRMIHREQPWLSIEELKEVYKR